MTGSGWRLRLFGQNHAVKAMAQGIAPNRTAHGEKMDEMKKTAVAQAEMKGQRLASGTGSRRSGVAAMTVVSNISF